MMGGKTNTIDNLVRYFICTILIIGGQSCNSNTVLEEVRQFDYPSASGIELFKGNIYVIGDDAGSLLVIDSSLSLRDSIMLYENSGRRLPKQTKPDLEAITTIQGNKLLIVGSGSLAPYRDRGWIIDPVTKQKDSILLNTFYRRLTLNGIKEVNIEGITSIPGGIVLSNRGNKDNRKNHLIFTRNRFWEHQTSVPVTTVCVGGSTDTTFFNGISGLAYSFKSDQLLLTVSTEDTRNSFDDGAIGKSYLWIIKSISSKKNWNAINPNQIIDLEETDARFKRQKIESVCILKETNSFFYLLLTADNDKGTSTVFRMAVEK